MGKKSIGYNSLKWNEPPMMNCKNCGAPLHGDCEYCGTRYSTPLTQSSLALQQAMMNQSEGLNLQTATGAAIAAQKESSQWLDDLLQMQLQILPPKF